VAERAPVRILGFPVTITPGFVLGLLLIVGLNAADADLAVRLAIALAVFTLVHELGHALVARHFGADVAISLNFLVGWASYRAPRPLTRAERAAVSAAGPFVEIALGVAALLALGADPFSHADVSTDALTLAIWWAGPVLGLLNLLPVLPLDGGNILSLGLDAVVPGHGHRLVQWWTFAVCAMAIVAVAVSPSWRPWALTVGLFALWNLQSILADRRRSPAGQASARRALVAAADAEHAAWTTGRPGLFPPPYAPSPWYRAAVLLAAGRPTTAASLLTEALEHGGGTWLAPSGASAAQLGPLLELVADPAPVDDLQAGYVLQQLLHETGYLRRAAEYGARLYERHKSPAVAHLVARSLALLGHDEAAVGWLRAAHHPGADPTVLDDADLASLRGRADFQALRAELAARQRAA
jgi:Zn-dependent protease